ncbi:division plane positioning ATPase MipZ [Parvularcula maris]|uniref:Division plane positioning ATPase MipZ n=1 Tax=Parvularcula maris TaxID=2965077 RepID=A0A9X2RKU5_9PROT|nr:division plane positioning ATPase MipZ [Parvularcula maris]MCQ8186138.1 division plane positioning ATPase MipZ [Parvularcula maris]
MSTERNTHVIVTGNEKGGSGKTTVAMHLVVSLMKAGRKVGVLDLDTRQKSLWRYLENRAQWGVSQGLTAEDLPIPKMLPLQGSEHDSHTRRVQDDDERLRRTLAAFSDCDFLVIDTPGADTHLSRTAHCYADTIVTPMNDSFVDFDLLAKVCPTTGEILGPSLYAETVWKARQTRAQSGVTGGIDWVVMRNRMQATNAKNKAAMAEKLADLSKRIQFRQARGFGERVIYRELFRYGMTLLDLGTKASPRKLSSMSHLAARQELRSMLSCLRLPMAEGVGEPVAQPAKSQDSAPAPLAEARRAA